MQLLARIRTGGFDAWRRAFAEEEEKRGIAGLTLLQLWQDADDEGTALALFEVSDRGRAQEYLATEAAIGDGLGDTTFLRLA